MTDFQASIVAFAAFCYLVDRWGWLFGIASMIAVTFGEDIARGFIDGFFGR